MFTYLFLCVSIISSAEKYDRMTLFTILILAQTNKVPIGTNDRQNIRLSKYSFVPTHVFSSYPN